MNESTKIILNSASKPLRVWLEPWAEELQIPPGEEFRFVGVSEQSGQFQIAEADDGLILYSWPTSRLTVYHGNEIVWKDFGVPVPSIPVGMSMPAFVDLMFRSREAKEKPRPVPWWKFWGSRKQS